MVRVDGKELNRSAEFEAVLNIRIGLAHHLDSQLVQRVVIAASHLDWPPCIAAFHLPFYPDLFGLLTEGLLFSIILQLQQEALLLE